jgi:hypothetical protein
MSSWKYIVSIAKMILLTHKYMIAHFHAWYRHFNERWRGYTRFNGPRMDVTVLVHLSWNTAPAISHWSACTKHESEQSCICALVVSFLPLSTILFIGLWKCFDIVIFFVFHVIYSVLLHCCIAQLISWTAFWSLQ